MSLDDEIKKLESLRDSGAMTTQDLSKAKARLIVDDVCARYRSKRRHFDSITAFFAIDREAQLDTDTFTSGLWPLLCQRISSVETAAELPRPVVHYYASNLLEFDVGNGGFAQAAYNYPQWFSLAADGYDALGFPRSASLLRDAMRWLPSEQRELKKKGLFSATIGQVFGHFSESRIAIFDERIIDSEWYVTEARVRFARENQSAFCAIE